MILCCWSCFFILYCSRGKIVLFQCCSPVIFSLCSVSCLPFIYLLLLPRCLTVLQFLSICSIVYHFNFLFTVFIFIIMVNLRLLCCGACIFVHSFVHWLSQRKSENTLWNFFLSLSLSLFILFFNCCLRLL